MSHQPPKSAAQHLADQRKMQAEFADTVKFCLECCSEEGSDDRIEGICKPCRQKALATWKEEAEHMARLERLARPHDDELRATDLDYANCARRTIALFVQDARKQGELPHLIGRANPDASPADLDAIEAARARPSPQRNRPASLSRDRMAAPY